MLDAINGSTGRSYSTEHKLPTFVLTGSYDLGLRHAPDEQGSEDRAVACPRHAHADTARRARPSPAGTRRRRHLAADADHTEIARWLDGLEEGD